MSQWVHFTQIWAILKNMFGQFVYIFKNIHLNSISPITFIESDYYTDFEPNWT